MRVIYVIGGICNGKSTICKELEKRGATYIDLDVLSKGLASDPEVCEAVKKIGVEALVQDGKLHAPSLSNYVFSSRYAAMSVDEAIHPFVLKRLKSELEKLEKEGCELVVVEYSGYYGQSREDDIFLRDADYVVWVESPLRDKVVRAESRGMAPYDVTWKMRCQPYDEEYAAVADFVIRNNGSMEELDERIQELWTACR